LTLLSHVIDDHELNELNGFFHEYYIDNEIYEFPKRSKIRVIRKIRGLKSFCVFEKLK
jgi:hypothetical protein